MRWLGLAMAWRCAGALSWPLKKAPLGAVERSDRAVFFAAVEARDLKAAAWCAPAAYGEWWRMLLAESPEHVAIETLLIAFLVYLAVTSLRRKGSGAPSALTDAEIDELVEEWVPEPLAPPPSAAAGAVLRSWKVVDALKDGYATVRSGGGGGSARKLLNCAAFDFLGLGGDAAVAAAATAALDKYGCGSCGPRGFYGSIDVHEELEERAAAFMGTERAIAFSDSASCCTSTVAAFAKRGDLLVVDDALCEPLRTGCVLSRATVVAFKHGSAADLERVLAAVDAADFRRGRAKGTQRRFVVAEAISRDVGDVAPLAAIVALKEKYGYRLILDESLSVGVLGPTGRGLCEAAGVSRDRVEITTIDAAPVLASLGGLCVGGAAVIDHQRLSGAGYCFSAAAPPFYSAAALAALAAVDAGGARLAKLAANAGRLQAGLRSAAAPPGLIVVAEDAAAQRVPFALLALAAPTGDAAKDLAALEGVADRCASKGYAVAVAKYDESAYAAKKTALPPLRPKPPVLKVTVSARHSANQIDALLSALASAAKPLAR